jgi:GT2 family glycosyltransferase
VKLSIVILCWNDRDVIDACLRSIYRTTRHTQFEVIVSDNGSTDGSPAFIRTNYPQVQVLENGRNLRFAKANNVGIEASRGEYILILNPDTIIHDGTLDGILALADRHPEAAAFGCRVLNADGSYQISARPFASIRGDWVSGLYLRSLGHLSARVVSDTYVGWDGTSERTVDWITGCFMLIRADLLKALCGFDEQFFYYYEDMDLCRRIWLSGNIILYTPEVSITHLKGQSTNQRFPPVAFALDSQVTRYLYYYKYEGRKGVRRARRSALVSLILKRMGYTVAQAMKPVDATKRRLDSLRLLFQWHWLVDPVRLVEHGEEPRLSTPIPGRVLER